MSQRIVTGGPGFGGGIETVTGGKYDDWTQHAIVDGCGREVYRTDEGACEDTKRLAERKLAKYDSSHRVVEVFLN